MSEVHEQETPQSEGESILERFHIQSSEMLLWTILYGLLGAGFFIVLSFVPRPYIMVDLFMFGLAPAMAIITVAGAIRGPIAGFLTGYVGTLVYDLIVSTTVVTFTLTAVAFGVMGFIVGLARYDFTNGRSLAKMAILSIIGLVFTVLLTVAVGLTVEVYADLVVLGFVMLPLLTVGIPSVFLLTPLYARLWYAVMSEVMPDALSK
ncbi:MAG: ECF transporter S component [Candidatus Thorarchaeota archaeon]